MATGAEALVRALDRSGVSVVFGVPGPDNLPLIMALRSQPLRFVGLQDPGQALRAADGFARRTGKMGVVVNGPGRYPLAACPEVVEALQAEAPLLLVEIEVASPPLPGPPRTRPDPEPKDASQVQPAVPVQTASLRPVDDVLSVLRHARDRSLSSPGGPVELRLTPAFLSSDATVDADEDTSEQSSEQLVATVEHQQLRRAAKLVDDSQHVLIWAGGGALRANAGGSVAELAEKLGAPVITTVQAAGLLPARHPCLVGLPPQLPAVSAMWDKADLIVAVGSDFDEQSTQGWQFPSPKALIAINIDAADAGRNYRPDVLLRGDGKTLTKALADVVSYRGGTAVVRSRLQDLRNTVRGELAQSDPQEMAFLKAVADAIPDRTTVVADPCAAGRWLAAFHEWTLPRTLLYPTELTTIGYALPAAIGAVMSGTTEPVVAVLGDQGLLGSMGQLAVLARERLPLTLLVVDDNGSGRLRARLAALGADEGALDRASPDFAAAARTFGLRADSLETVGDDLTTALRAHIVAPDPTMLVVKAALNQPPTDESRWPDVHQSRS